MSGVATNGVPIASVALGTLPLTGNEKILVDTGLANGVFPQTEALQLSQLSTLGYGAVLPKAYASALAIDVSTGSYFSTTLTGNATLSFLNPSPGQEVFVEVTQDGTGSRTLGYTNVSWASGTAPTLTTTANATDVLRFTYNATAGKWRGETVGKAFA